MKFYKKSQEWRASNLVVQHDLTAYSYQWYVLAKVFNGVLVLNTYRYSARQSEVA